jgi:hypothetical protein
MTVKGNQLTLQTTRQRRFTPQPFSPSAHTADPRDPAGA